MSVSGISGASSSTSITGSTKGIADNFESFLSLLITQLKNQNPLDPLDTNQFTQQLVQFSSVEQQLKTNSYLSALVGSTANSVNTNAVGYIGKVVTASGTRSELANGRAVWNFSLPEPANINVTIRDGAGNVVYTEQGALQQGAGNFVWDGKDNTGNTRPPGTYSIAMTATNSTGKTVNVSTEMSGTVTGVDFTGSEPVLLIGQARVNLSGVTSVVSSAG
jgi:flagellar basal-body rod modification protein FlgD